MDTSTISQATYLNGLRVECEKQLKIIKGMKKEVLEANHLGVDFAFGPSRNSFRDRAAWDKNSKVPYGMLDIPAFCRDYDLSKAMLDLAEEYYQEKAEILRRALEEL